MPMQRRFRLQRFDRPNCLEVKTAPPRMLLQPRRLICPPQKGRSRSDADYHKHHQAADEGTGPCSVTPRMSIRKTVV